MDIRFLKTSVTRSAIVSWTLELPILRSFLDEHHFGVIDCVWLKNNSSESKFSKQNCQLTILNWNSNIKPEHYCSRRAFEDLPIGQHHGTRSDEFEGAYGNDGKVDNGGIYWCNNPNSKRSFRSFLQFHERSKLQRTSEYRGLPTMQASEFPELHAPTIQSKIWITK